LLNPDPSEWLTAERKQALLIAFTDVRHILGAGGLLPTAIRAWIRRELALEAEWLDGERTQLGEQLSEAWMKHNDARALGIAGQSLVDYLTIPHGVHRWCVSHWGAKLESLFLEQKDSLDQVSFFLLRVNELSVARELYYRLKAGESNFPDLNYRFGTGREAPSGGFFPLMSFSDVPYGLAPFLRGLEVQAVSGPVKIGKKYAVLSVQESIPAEFNNETKKVLINSHLKLWMKPIEQELLDLFNSLD